MAVEPVPNYPPLTPGKLDEIESIAEAYAKNDTRYQQTSSSHTVGRSVHTSGHPFTSSDRPLKRQRVDSPLPHDMYIDMPSSRDAMPPPSKPLSRMRSVRGLIPNLRRKFSSNRTSPKEHRKDNGDVQMFDNGHWRDAVGSRVHNDRSSSLAHNMRSETPYMSGALPVEQAPQEPHLLASMGSHGNASEFSFRASSPVKLNGRRGKNHPVQLSTEPSYLRLMDGLSSNNGLELGLKDPRENTSTHYGTSKTVRPPVSTPQTPHAMQDSRGQQRWGLGHAFLHQSPNAPPKTTTDQRTPPLGMSNGYFSRAQYEPPQAMTTSAPIQLQQPVRQVDSVVSPFFGRSHCDEPIQSRPRITETQTSSHRSGASRSQRHLTSQTSAEWSKQPSLNGLSFINTPFDACNGSIMHGSYRHLTQHEPSRKPHAQTLTSRGLVMWPDAPQFPFANDGGYGSSMHLRTLLPRQQQAQSQLTIHPSNSNRAPPSRIEQLPSSMPSIVSSHSPVRNRTQWETLQRAGVRSSRQTHGKIRGNMFNAPLSSPFLRIERRNVRQ